MIGQLEVVAGPDAGRCFPLEEGQVLPIGRGSATVTKLRDPYVSRLHCQVEVEKSGLVTLTDLGGAEGTRVNGQPIKRHVLIPGDVIAIGDTQLRVNLSVDVDGGTVCRPAPVPATPKRRRAELTADVMDLTGCTLGPYEVDEIVARGQSSVVFRGHDAANQTVALKVLRPELAASDESVARFVRCFNAVMPLKHPNLIAVYASDRAGPYCWMAMEYVDGESLKQVIARMGLFGILDWRYALRVAVHIARGLAFAAQHGVLHRNVTPANILIRKSDNLAKLGDLMLAKAIEDAGGPQITMQGSLVGDVAYMSPERTGTGDPVDGRSDLYELGATVYALLTGRPPCLGTTPADTIQKIRKETPASPRSVQLSVPEAFAQIVMKTLAKKPGERYASATELLAALEEFARVEEVDLTATAVRGLGR